MTRQWNTSETWGILNDTSTIALQTLFSNVTELSTSATNHLQNSLQDEDDDDPFLLSDDMVEVSKNVQMVIRYIIVVFAIPLTICNVVVFLQKSMRSSTSIYVVFLSFAQLIFIVCNIIVNIVSELVANPFTKIEFCMYYIYVSIYVGIVAKRGSYLVMCLLSLERLYAVVKPLHIKEFFLSKFPVLCICLAYALSALWHMYIPLRTTVEEAFHPVIGVYCKFQRTELYLKTTAVNDFFSLSAKIVLSYGALFGQMVLNLLTIWALKRHNVKSNMVKSTASDDSKKQRERQLTVTILAATISYVTLSFLSVLLSLLSTVYPTFYEAGKYRNIYSILIDLSFNLNILSMAIDFLCFFSMSANYRKTLLQMLPCKTCCAARNAKAVVVETEQRRPSSLTLRNARLMLPCRTCCAARNAKAVVAQTEQKIEFSDTQTS